MIFRNSYSGCQTLNDEIRTVEVIVATEDPVKIRDWEYGDVDEILLMSGVILPETKRLPLFDASNRFETSRVIGLFRNIKVREGNLGHLVGTAEFSSEPGRTFSMLKGHPV